MAAVKARNGGIGSLQQRGGPIAPARSLCCGQPLARGFPIVYPRPDMSDAGAAVSSPILRPPSCYVAGVIERAFPRTGGLRAPRLARNTARAIPEPDGATARLGHVARADGSGSHPRLGPSRIRVAIWAIALGATCASWSTARAYRTFEDDSAVLYPARHETAALVWSVAGADGSDRDRVIAAAEFAFATWCDVECTGLSAHFDGAFAPEHAQPGDGRSTIEIVRTAWSHVGVDASRGATTDVQLVRDEATGDVVIREADIYLDFEHFQWEEGSTEEGALDPRAVIIHELGHLFGVLHPCERGAEGVRECVDGDRGSVLYPLYIGPDHLMLSSDDIAAICALYPAMPCAPACGPGLECVSGACVPCTDAACLAECPLGGCVYGECSAGCAAGSSCAVTGEHESECVSLGALGTECSSGDVCTSGLCLTRTAGPSYCTRLCGEDADCTGQQRCAEVDGRAVCAPLPPPSGCAVARSSGSGRSSSVLGLMISVIAVCRFGRRSNGARR